MVRYLVRGCGANALGCGEASNLWGGLLGIGCGVHLPRWRLLRGMPFYFSSPGDAPLLSQTQRRCVLPPIPTRVLLRVRQKPSHQAFGSCVSQLDNALCNLWIIVKWRSELELGQFSLETGSRFFH